MSAIMSDAMFMIDSGIPTLAYIFNLDGVWAPSGSNLSQQSNTYAYVDAALSSWNCDELEWWA